MSLFNAGNNDERNQTIFCENNRLTQVTCVGVECQIGFHNARESPIRRTLKQNLSSQTVRNRCELAHTIYGFI